jgi:hypothetical protein
VTTIVELPTQAVAGFTTIVPVVPGPVAVLQVTATVAVAVNVVACIVPAQIVRAIKPPNANALLLVDTDKSI